MSDSDAADGSPQQRQPDEIQEPPGEHEGQPGHEVVLGAQQNGERREMQQHQHADAQTMAFAGQGGQPCTTEKCERGRHVTGAAPRIGHCYCRRRTTVIIL